MACCGDRDGVSHRARQGGRWQRLLPGVYAAVTGAVTADQRDMAALLYGGQGCVITGRAALRGVRIDIAVAETVDVLEATLPDGEKWAMDACVVVRMKDGKITRLDEYLDSAKSGALRKFGR